LIIGIRVRPGEIEHEMNSNMTRLKVYFILYTIIKK